MEFLPKEIENIIMDNKEDMEILEMRHEHKKHFQKTLDIVKNLQKRYFTDEDSDILYIVYSLNMTFEEECDFFMKELIFRHIQNITEELDLDLFDDEIIYDSEEDEYDFDDGWIINDMDPTRDDYVPTEHAYEQLSSSSEGSDSELETEEESEEDYDIDM